MEENKKLQRTTDHSHQNRYRLHGHQPKKKKLVNTDRKKNNSMNISSDKQTKSHTKKQTHDKENETLREKLNLFSSDSSIKNSIRIKYVKARIDKKQQKKRCRRYGDRDETINHIITE